MEKKLSSMDYEEEGIVIKVGGRLKYNIAGMGIRVGKGIKMMTKQPIKGPVVVTVDRSNTSIGLGLAGKILVRVKE
jgi:ferrous iron transport protein A